MKSQLPVVHANDSSESWLFPVQRAIINTRGVFAIRGIKDLTWENGCKLSRKILKTYMRATMHNPYDLHAGLDLHEGEWCSESRFLKSGVTPYENHVDRGLFSLVHASRIERRELHIEMSLDRGVLVDALSMTAAWGDELLVVIPGYSLHMFEPKLQAPLHSVRQHNGEHPRTTAIFKCRLRSDFEVNGVEIGQTLPHSMKQPAGSKFIVTLREVTTGRSFNFRATPSKSVDKLMRTYLALDQVHSDNVCLLFGGRRLLSDEMLEESTFAGAVIDVCPCQTVSDD